MIRQTSLLLALSAALALAAPKERNWQDGKLLNPHANRYFTQADLPDEGPGLVTAGGAAGNGNELAVHQLDTQSNLAYDHYIIESDESVYLTEVQRLKSFPAAKVTVGQPIRFAVEKSKLWMIGDDQKEYETKILKMVPKDGQRLLTLAKPAPAPKPEPKPVQAPAPKPTAKAAPAPAPKAVKPEKTERATTAKLEIPSSLSKSLVTPGTAMKKEPVTQLPVQSPASSAGREESKDSFVGVKLTPKPEPAVVKAPSPAPVEASARPTLKDRPWQSGRLLSAGSNSFFENIPYSTDMDGSSWTFTQNPDGKINVGVRAISLPTNPFTFDDYLIETEYCVYLVQHQRTKTSSPVRFNGATALKFAVEKNKLWVIDEEGKEVETKVVKQLQRDQVTPAAPGLAQTAAR